MFYFKYILVAFFCLSSGFSFAHQTHITPLVPPLLYPPVAPVGFCNVQTSSVCTTHSGNQCSFFSNHYQPSWFSACIGVNPYLHACLNSSLPLPGNLVFRQQCALRGSPCVCAFPTGYGYVHYERGWVY